MALDAVLVEDRLNFLDVAEMSFAVAIAVDWVGNWLPKETLKIAKLSLIEKGIKPSFNEAGTRMFWINSVNNWNAVCHGGMITAALVTADLDPDLALCLGAADQEQDRFQF